VARIGYGKIGRTVGLLPKSWGEVGGDNEPPILLNRLARRNPEHEFVLLGRNSGERPEDIGLPSNVTNPWPDLQGEVKRATSGVALDDVERTKQVSDALGAIIGPCFDDLDGVIVWTGQHGSTCSPIPTIANGHEQLTKPLASSIYYGSYWIHGLNRWRDVDPVNRQEVWLCPDVRNYVKSRDLKWPIPPVLAQYDFTRKGKHYRYGDESDPSAWEAALGTKLSLDSPGLWTAEHHYRYSRLEVTGIPSGECPLNNWSERRHFGMIVNEARANVKLNRVDSMRAYVLPLQPAFMRGTWSREGVAKLGLGFQPEPVDWHLQWDLYRSIRCTLTTPSSGGSWPGAKPWEAFSCGAVCFFHPLYDDQGHLLPTLRQVQDGQVDHDPDLKQLTQWLRVDSPDQLTRRVAAVNADEDTWRWLAATQRRLFDDALADARCIREIESRCRISREG
jgi:hypothetical protein